MPLPSTWYKYKFPLPIVPGAPVPSKANYKPANVAPLIEGIASVLGVKPKELEFRYENNTPKDKTDDIFVKHPLDKVYSVDPCADPRKPKSAEQLRYETAAKKSRRLKVFQDNSPAKITYFQDMCNGS